MAMMIIGTFILSNNYGAVKRAVESLFHSAALQLQQNNFNNGLNKNRQTQLPV